MAKQTINIGTYELDTDNSVDTIRAAFNKANENFSELYNNDSSDFNGDYSTLTNKPTIPADVSDLTDTTSLLTSTSANVEIETQTLGRTNSQDQFIPFIINDTVTGTLQDQIPATNLVNGEISCLLYSKSLSRYTSGGKLMLTLLSNGGVSHYATKEFLFSRVEAADGGVFDVIETGTGSDELMTGIVIQERFVNSELFLDVIITADNTGISATEFVRVIGQITYTSVPIFVTASGY